MSFKLHQLIIVTIILTYCIYCNNANDVIIKRRCFQNILNCTETIVYNTTSSRECNVGANALYTKDGIECKSKNQMNDIYVKDGTNCTTDSTGFPPTMCNASKDPFYIKTISDDSVWTLRHIPCLKIVDAALQIDMCNETTNNFGGLLIKFNYDCARLNNSGCIIFTLPGTISDDNINATIKIPTTTTTTVVTTITTKPIINATNRSINNNTITTSSPTTTITQQQNTTNMTIPIATKPTTKVTLKTLLPINPIAKPKESKKHLLYIILPCCLVLLIVAVCVVYILCCRKKCKCKRNRKDSVPLLEINAGKDAFEKEDLYAVPNKKKKKKSKPKSKDKNHTEGVLPSVWTGYDDVGAFIEGTYEARESMNLDPDMKYGVSAMLLKDEKSGIVLETTVTDDPYEQLGRCNSFTPKTRQQKSKYPRKLETDETDCNLNKPDYPEDAPDKLKHTPDNPEKLSDINKKPQDEVLPLITDSPRVSTFKPAGECGSSIRRKQQRTSMRKSQSAKGQESPSFTHEVVSITPQSAKKFKTQNKQPETTDNDNVPINGILTGDLTLPISDTTTLKNSYEKIPSDNNEYDKKYDNEYDKKSLNENKDKDGYEKVVSLTNEESLNDGDNKDTIDAPNIVKSGDVLKPNANSSVTIDNPYEELTKTETNEDKDESPYERLDEDDKGDNENKGDNEENKGDNDNNERPNNKCSPSKYADIEIVKDEKSNKRTTNQNGGGTNYTDVIIDDN